EHSDEIIEDEPQASHREETGQWGHDCREPGNELCYQHSPITKAGENILCLPDIPVWLGRETAQPRQHRGATAPPQLVPPEVYRQGDDHNRGHHERHAGAAACSERADSEQCRHGRERDTDLLRDHQDREHHDAISFEQLKALGWAHVYRPSLLEEFDEIHEGGDASWARVLPSNSETIDQLPNRQESREILAAICVPPGATA